MRAIIHWHLCQRNVDLYGINLSFQNQYQNAIAKNAGSKSKSACNTLFA